MCEGYATVACDRGGTSAGTRRAIGNQPAVAQIDAVLGEVRSRRDAAQIANCRVDTAELDAAIADYNGTVLAAVRQTADAMTQVQSLESQRADQQDALDSATRALALAETRYKSGLSDQIPMLNAENTLLTAREQMAGLIANSTIQRVTLLLSVGGGFNPQTQDADPSQINIAKD